ncbi:MAG: VPLPA-CTERM sorting domain-containing protein, partial [Desulfobaccales bacterium]
PATHVFDNLIVGTGGSFEGGAGDKFVINNDFINHSTQNLTWDTVMADLAFTGDAAAHQLYITGADLGQTAAGYLDNFAWGSLDLTGQMLTLLDGNDSLGGALYLGSILGVTLSGGQVTDIYGNGLDIYYNPFLAENAYLAGLTYDLTGGGHLAPVSVDLLGVNNLVPLESAMQQTPVPASIWLFLSGLAGLGLWRRKKSSARGNQ